MLEDQSGLEALFRDAVAIFKVLSCIFVFGAGGGYGEGIEPIDFGEGGGGGLEGDRGGQEAEADPAPLLSIALGILTAVLELGEEGRSGEEEEALQSLAPALTRLAEEYYYVEVKEMAGHAVAMIGARRSNAVDGEKKVRERREATLLHEHSLVADAVARRRRRRRPSMKCWTKWRRT